MIGAGIAIAAGGAATTATATGFWIHFKLERDKFNEKQKQIDAQYIPLAKKCKETVNKGKKATKGVQEKLKELEDIINGFKAIKKQLESKSQ